MCSVFSLFRLVVCARVTATYSSGAVSAVCGNAEGPCEGGCVATGPHP